MDGLKPANANPWYVLMTLYGEQVGEEVDWDLHARNRAVWNAWSCQGMTAEARAAAKLSGVDVAELRAWPGVAGEVARLHEAAMRARNGDGFVYPGLPDVGQVVDLSGVEFVHRLVLVRVFFNGEVRFGKATFIRDAEFGGTTFGGVVGFHHAQFSGAAFFNNATFGEAAFFEYAAFNRDAQFGGATFSGDAFFNNTMFSGTAWFANATFSGDAHFNDLKFCGVALFGGATFSGNVWFFRATFNQRAGFAGAHFGVEGGGQALDFSDCQFDKPTNFRDAVFHSCYPDFAGAVLHEKTTFSAEDKYWPKGVQPDPERARASCGVIRHNLGRQGLPEAEHFFFRREMGFATQIGGWWARLPYRLFGWFSDFGYSIARPAWWLLGLWGVGGLILHSLFQWQATFDGSFYNPVQAFALSFANMVPVLGLQRAWFDADFLTGLSGGLKFVGGVQTVFALLLLFFLGLGLRQRFRLR